VVVRVRRRLFRLRRRAAYDAFICHTSEDKDAVVRPLAARLVEQHVSVWYDEFVLRPGDSLRRSIDHGLAHSTWGIVVLSQAFFAKQWPQWELDGLVSRQNASGEAVILPIWHGVSRDDVLAYSPPLADKFAANTADGLHAVVEQLLAVVKPQGSTLVIAQQTLLEWEMHSPPVTDDWWRTCTTPPHER
jgi:hypothetical protein